MKKQNSTVYSDWIEVRKGGIIWKITQRYTSALTYITLQWSEQVSRSSCHLITRYQSKVRRGGILLNTYRRDPRWEERVFTGICSKKYPNTYMYKFHTAAIIWRPKNRKRQLTMVYHWSDSIIYTSVYSMVYLFNAFLTLCIQFGYSFASATKNVTVPRWKKPSKRALYRDIPPAGLHFHCIKKRVFLLAGLTFLMLCRLSGGTFLAGSFRWPASL